MASITVRNLDDRVKRDLRKQAAEHGRSLEAEAREILERGISQKGHPVPKTGLDLFKGIMAIAEKHGGFELELPKRGPIRGVKPLRAKRQVRGKR